MSSRFSLSAETYDARATVQRHVAQALVQQIPVVPRDLRILEIGCGTGILTQLLLARFPDVLVDALDISDRMIEQGRSSLALEPRVSWIVRDVREYQPALRYELIVSSSSLHWVRPLEAAFSPLATMLDAQGKCVLALMVDGTLGELRAARLQVASHKRPLSRLPTGAEVREALLVSGLRIIREEEQEIREYHRSASEFLRSIHELGVTGGAVSHGQTLLTRSELQALMREYDRRFRNGNGSVYSTYRVLFVIAEKSH